jgi:hypothetical protein
VVEGGRAKARRTQVFQRRKPINTSELVRSPYVTALIVVARGRGAGAPGWWRWSMVPGVGSW